MFSTSLGASKDDMFNNGFLVVYKLASCTMMPPEDLPQQRARLVSQRFGILRLLYPDKKLNFTQIAEVLQMDVGNVSKYAWKLQRFDLIQIEEKNREGDRGGRPYQICSLTSDGKQIFGPLVKTESLDVAPSALETSLFIGTLENKRLTEDFREFIASKLSDLATSKADELVEQKDSRELLESVAEGSSLHNEDKVNRQLMSVLTNSIPGLATQKKNKEWFTKKIYEPLCAKVSNEKETPATREWALRNMSRVARLTDDSDLRNSVIEKLLKIYFDDSNDLSTVAKDELSKFGPDHRQTILKHALSCTDKPEKRTKAEALMKELISLSWPTNLNQPSKT
jgi:predicted ArsR family transcriptional regulator